MKNLNKRKTLAAKVLGVGEGRILFDTSRLEEIKEAITKQDIRDLYAEGLIMIKPAKGRGTHKKRTTRRGPGKIKMTVRTGKRDYIVLVRKFRRYVEELRRLGKIDMKKYNELRVRIKAREFKDKGHLREHIGVKA